MQGSTDEWWWIKSDGGDIVAGLTESMRGEWGGDVDLGDGELARKYGEYSKLLLCRQLTNPIERCHTLVQLANIKKLLEYDLEFLPTCRVFVFAHKLLIFLFQVSRNLMMNFMRNSPQERKQLTRIYFLLAGQLLNWVGWIVMVVICTWSCCPFMFMTYSKMIPLMARRLSTLQGKCLSFFQGISRHKRVAVSHILVTMLNATRSHMLCQSVVFPTKVSLESKARSHINSVISHMKKRNMIVAGEV